MNAIFDTYKRWRHRRGFGIHSPLAYALIMDCVRINGPQYYKEQEIIRSALPRDEQNHRRRRLRLKEFLIYQSRTPGPNGSSGHPLEAEYISNPNPRQRKKVMEALSGSGGVMLDARDFIISVVRDDIPFIRYLI